MLPPAPAPDCRCLPLLPRLSIVTSRYAPARPGARAEFFGRPQGDVHMSATPRLDPKALLLAQCGTLHPHPQRVQDALFRGSTFFDPRDLIQVRYEMVRRFRVNG